MRLLPRKEATLLDLAELSETSARAVAELLNEGESANTQASYRSALRYWAAWFRVRYGRQLQAPVPASVVLQFIVDHAQRMTDTGLKNELPATIDAALVASGHKGKPGPLAMSTLEHRVYVLSKVHQLRQLDNPCEKPKVKELMAMTRRAYAKRGAMVQKKDALTRDPLLAVLATCDDSLRGVRDRALLLFAWSTGGRRRSEVGNADLRALREVGPNEYAFRLAHSKSNQDGADRAENYKPVVGDAATALRNWLAAAQITEGAIFRRIRKGGHVGEALSAAAVRSIVQQRCALAGLSGDFSAHSLRSGFVTEAGRQAVPLADTMALTGHRSVQSVVGYMRAGSSQLVALRLLSEPDPGK